ncbi:MAG: hypothetical protein GXO90_07650 [FCB group bacterium]|nr:hypothetical protein [FCB group bacterium]
MSESSVFSLEEKYQALEQQLILFPMDRMNLHRLVRFFYQNSASLRPFRSYYIETAEWFELLFTPQSLKFQSPEFYQELFQVLKTGSQIVESGPIESLFHDLIRTWKHHAAEMQFYLGEYLSGIRVLRGGKEVLHLTDIHPGQGVSDYQYFHSWLGVVKAKNVALDSEDWEILEKIDIDWESVTRLSRDQIWTLLIPRESGIENSSPDQTSVQVGILQPLLVTTELLSDRTGEDAVIFHNKTSTINDLAYQQSWDAVQAARQIYPRRGYQSKNRLKVIYSFPDTTSVYTGDSMGFAMGLVTVANLSRILESFQEYRLPQSIVVTGAMDQHGILRPISPESLRIKMNAVFYSSFEGIGIPAENRDEAQKLYNRFLQRYPHRHLEIIPIKSLREALHHPRLVIKQAVPFKQQLKIISRNWAAIAALILLTLLGVIFLPTWDRNPASLKMDKEGLSIYNKQHKTLWTYPIDSESWPQKWRQQKRLDTWNRASLIADLDGDGKHEVVTKSLIQKKENWSGELLFFESNGNLKWHYEDFPRIKFGDIWFEPFYRPGKIISIPPENFRDNSTLVVSMPHIPWYPDLLMKFSIEGEVLGTYIHSGVVNIQLKNKNTLQSGNQILFFGTNNDYNSGVLGILDAEHIRGHSPQDQFEYTPQGVELADHELYMRFPQLTDIFPYRARSNVILVLKKTPTEYRVDLHIGAWGGVIYTLDTNFQYRDVDFTDGLLIRYRTEYNRDLLEDYTLDEIKWRLSRIEYWEDGQWVVHQGVLDSVNQK